MPGLRQQTTSSIEDAMASAGLGGSRFSTFAADKAAEIGAEEANRFNSMFADKLLGQSNLDLDRALSASTAGMGYGAQDWQRAMQASGQLGAYGESGLARGLQATGMAPALAAQQEQQERQRIQDLFTSGQYEQQRQDQFAGQAYNDFISGRKGWINDLMNVASGVSAGTQPPYIQDVKPGKGGLLDILMPGK